MPWRYRGYQLAEALAASKLLLPQWRMLAAALGDHYLDDLLLVSMLDVEA